MRKLIARLTALVVCLFLFTSDLFSQGVPDGIIFQALAKDPSGVPARGRKVHIKDAIIQTTATGTVVYSESFVLTASEDGVFTITIGKGTRVSGVNKLSDIDWNAGPFFLNIKAAIEPTVATPEWKAEEQYVDMGTSQFWTVPFAFTAAKVAGLELYLKAADTATMLAPYLRKIDTASLSNRIEQLLKLSDTSNMLNVYLRKLDTALMLSPYLRKGDSAGLASLIGGKLNMTDTSSMLAPYLRRGELVNLDGSVGAKLNIADTAAMLAGYLQKNDTSNLSNRINDKLNTADTISLSNRIDAKLNMADTIFLSNRIDEKLSSADTATMLSNYLRKSDIGSIGGGGSGGGSSENNGPDPNKLNISDTLAMLNSYLRKLDTAVMLSPYLKKFDTVLMLNPYLRKADTLSLSNRIDTKFNSADTTGLLSRFYTAASAIADLAAKEDAANKSSNTGLGTSDILFPTQRAVKIYVDSVLAAVSASPDATTTVKGRVQLAGDLTGTADAPLIADGKITTAKIADSAVSFSKIQNIAAQKIIGNPTGTTGTAREITLGNGLALNGDTLNVVGGSSGVTSVDTFTSNITVYSTNGLGKYTQGQVIPAIGKTASQVLLDALTQTIPPTYVQPTVGVSSSPSAGTVEIGAALNITLSSSFNQNDAGAQTSVSFSKNGSGLGGNTDNIASLTASVSYTATVSYGQGPVKNNNLGAPDPTGRINAGSRTSGSITFTPQARRYWGYSATATPTDVEIRAALGGGSELSSAKAKGSFDITISSGTHYVFFAYPASSGSLSSLSVGGFGSLPAFTLTTRSFTNVNGYAQSYNIYVSQNTFATTVSNIITN